MKKITQYITLYTLAILNSSCSTLDLAKTDQKSVISGSMASIGDWYLQRKAHVQIYSIDGQKVKITGVKSITVDAGRHTVVARAIESVGTYGGGPVSSAKISAHLKEGRTYKITADSKRHGGEVRLDDVTGDEGVTVSKAISTVGDPLTNR